MTDFEQRDGAALGRLEAEVRLTRADVRDLREAWDTRWDAHAREHADERAARVEAQATHRADIAYMRGRLDAALDGGRSRAARAGENGYRDEAEEYRLLRRIGVRVVRHWLWVALAVAGGGGVTVAGLRLHACVPSAPPAAVAGTAP